MYRNILLKSVGCRLKKKNSVTAENSFGDIKKITENMVFVVTVTLKIICYGQKRCENA